VKNKNETAAQLSQMAADLMHLSESTSLNGITLHSGQWLVRVKRRYVGQFEHLSEAIAARDAKRRELGL
jgi:hypothetical protein